MTNTPRAARLVFEFGRRLRACRIAAGYAKAAHLAKDLHISEIRYRKYERGAAVPPLDVLARIKNLTGKDLDFLLLGELNGEPDRKPGG